MINKTVLLPIIVPNNNYCWDGRIGCEHFDNEGGHGRCLLELGSLIRDDTGYYPKPIECVFLKETLT